MIAKTKGPVSTRWTGEPRCNEKGVDALTVDQIAMVTGQLFGAVYRWIRSGRLPGRAFQFIDDVGRTRWVLGATRTDVKKFLKASIRVKGTRVAQYRRRRPAH